MKYITISDINIPMRLDRYLYNLSNSLTQGVVQKYIRNGNIKLNNKKTLATSRVVSGDILGVSNTIYKMLEDEWKKQKERKYDISVKSLAQKILSDYLIFSCEYFIAINKPSGISVQGGSKINLSIDHALSYINSSLTDGKPFKLVHRLDKDTSGVMVIAKGHDNSIILTRAFRDRLLCKKYIAILCGTPRKKEGSIDNNIYKTKFDTKHIANNKNVIQIAEKEVKIAETCYKILARDAKYSLVEFTPITGRTHQIRIHSKDLGCPILGDKKYGGDKYDRLMLHSYFLQIPKSIFSHEFIIEKTQDDSFDKLIKNLQYLT